MKKKLVGFDGPTIYRVYIKEKNNIIRVKDLQIFENTATKTYSALPDFNGKPIFDKIQLSDTKKDLSSPKSAIFKDKIKIKRCA